MFKMVENPEFIHEVPVMVPIDSGHREERFRCRFRAIPEALATELIEVEDAKPFVRRIVVEIMDVVDAVDRPLGHSEAMLEQMANLRGSRRSGR